VARKYVAFGKSAVDVVVAAFLKSKGIKGDDVIGYRLSRGVDDMGTISIDMYFEDIPESDIIIFPATEQQED